MELDNFYTGPLIGRGIPVRERLNQNNQLDCRRFTFLVVAMTSVHLTRIVSFSR